MPRRRGWIALTALALLGGCAPPPAQQDASAEPSRGKLAASRSPVVNCATKDIGIATVSKCGTGGLRFGVATE